MPSELKSEYEPAEDQAQATANPNANLRALISSGQVREYQSNRLGAAIYILPR